MEPKWRCKHCLSETLSPNACTYARQVSVSCMWIVESARHRITASKGSALLECVSQRHVSALQATGRCNVLQAIPNAPPDVRQERFRLRPAARHDLNRYHAVDSFE